MRSMRVPGPLAGAAIAVAIGMLGMPASAAGVGKSPNGIYIVQLSAPPVVENAATKPANGQKVDPNSAAVVKYLNQLSASQDAALASVGAGAKIHSYGFVFNGVSAKMTEQQASRLARMPGVLSVTPDEMRHLDTSSTTAFLGLSGPGGFWESTGFKGDNIIIGVVDSGITPQHPSFAGTAFGAAPVRWKGGCSTAATWSGADCNNKLIGARFYNAGFGGNAGITAQFPYEFLSARDYDGHGSHTASTAGGNEGVAVAPTSKWAPFNFGPISGMAPRARVAAYKVCWGSLGETHTPPVRPGCASSDSVAAIDQAVADGVDVINYSISGTQTDLLDPVETAFRRAASAGVFVAASAGNSGPGFFTVAHPSPWITTVAAATHDRLLQGTLTLGNSAVYSGASAATGMVAAGTQMILSSDAILAGHTATQANLCHSSKDTGGNALDPAKVTGKIVVCDRGATDRVNKSLAVMEAGGVGMVLINTSASTLNPDFHSVPSVHLSHTVRAAVRNYVGSPVPTGTGAISKGTVTYGNPAPNIASFSSRGPISVANLLKPDIAAPGQDILAAFAPTPVNGGDPFNVISGTSMSSPHIAGIAALFKQARPTWSPMAIKSAMMTSSIDLLDGPPESIFSVLAQGAGFVQPNRALNPGLIFDSGPNDWNAFLCGQGLSKELACPVINIDPSDLNLPSIAISALAGSQTVKRRVTNVSGNAATFTAVANVPGYAVTVNPSTLSLAAGQTGQFSVTITRITAGLGCCGGGQIVWTGAGTKVRMPLQLQATAATASAPAQALGTGGLMKYKVNVGYTGPFSVSTRGLVAPQLNTGTASTGSSQSFPVVIPAGTTYARFSLFSSDVLAGSDIDIVVRDPGGVAIAFGYNGGSDEEVNLTNPAAGTYTVDVEGFFVPAPGTSPFKLHSWVLGSTSANNMQAYAPFMVTAGQQIDVSIIPIPFRLSYGTKYLGSVVYSGNPGLPAPTIIRIDR